jgi:hypothetical protein
MTKVLISKSLGITYGSQFTKMTDHLVDRVPPGLDIMEGLQLGNFDGFLRCEPSILVAISDSLLKLIASYTRRTDRSDSGTTKRNGVAFNCFRCGITWGGLHVELSLLIKAFDDVSGTYIDDVREAPNAVVEGTKDDASILE